MRGLTDVRSRSPQRRREEYVAKLKEYRELLAKEQSA